jgi:hypothetical protein
MKWGLNFRGHIKPIVKNNGNQYIIDPTNYNIKWVDVEALRDNTTKKHNQIHL